MIPFKRILVFATLPLVIGGCSLLPDVRVFQKTIPTDTGKPAKQTEAERMGAKYIAMRSAEPEPNAAAQIAAIHSVAVPLSNSLGEPVKPVSVAAIAPVINDLSAGLLAEQKKAEAWRAFGLKYGGKQIEGTGIDLAGPGAFLGVAGLVALFVFVPGALSIALVVIRRLRGTIQTMAQAVEEHAAENPEEGKAIKARVNAAADRIHAAIIEREKKFLNWKKIQRATAAKAQSNQA